jgi:hypothetical protein
MRRRNLYSVLLLPVLLAGCGAPASSPEAVPRAAGAQTATLGWIESTGSPQSRLVFRVRSFSVTRSGWSAELSVTNDTSATFSIKDEREAPNHSFGLMVFRTGSHAELEQRNTPLALPVLRSATTFSPALPASLGPHATWDGTASAHGALPAGLWVRFVFGVFVPKEKMPESLSREGVPDALIWITDHAHRLRL